MQRKTKLKIMLLVVLVALSFAMTKPSTVLAETSTPSTIEANWLSVVPGDFVDLSQHPYENKLKVAVGGEDLLSFQSLGVVYDQTDDNKIVYKSRAIFGEEVVAYSAVTLRDTFPDFSTTTQGSIEYFRLDRFYIWGTATEKYNIRWYETSLENPQYHDYNGYIPVTFKIKPFQDTSGYLHVGGVSIPAPTYSSEILQARVQDVVSAECGVYGDEFVDVGIQDTKITIVPTVDTFSAPQQALIDWYNNHDLGIAEISVIRQTTMNQGEVSADSIGTTYHNPTPQQSLTANMKVIIVPEVSKYSQDIKVRRAGIVYWQWGFFAGNIDPTYGVETRVVPRIIGGHVDNYYVHYHVIVTVDFYATVPSNAELTQSVLDDPYLQLGTFVWDTSLFGTESAELPFTTGNFWIELLAMILPWLIIIIVAGVAILAVYLYIVFRRKKKNNAVNIILKNK